jgi:hypothetical protein
MPALDSGLTVEPMRARERPAAELEALFTGGWPAFIGADPAAEQYLPTVRSTFGDLEVAVLQHGVLMAAGWGVPIAWDSTAADLPSGYSESLARAVTGRDTGLQPNTFVICAAQVRSDGVRSGLAKAVLQGLIDTAEADQLPRVIAPLRPTLKHRYPLTPIEDYVTWTRADGSAFDPWLRSHQRMGATVLGTSPASQTFTGTVQQWEEWAAIALPGDGSYVIHDALSPLQIDHGADTGTCTEPAIWVQHR